MNRPHLGILSVARVEDDVRLSLRRSATDPGDLEEVERDNQGGQHEDDCGPLARGDISHCFS